MYRATRSHAIERISTVIAIPALEGLHHQRLWICFREGHARMARLSCADWLAKREIVYDRTPNMAFRQRI
jgi:hypothetical protein